MSLREDLKKLLEKPGVLPEKPEDAINGTKLLGLIKPELADYSDATIRQHFSIMAADGHSPIAKLGGKHGYYRRADQLPIQTAAAPAQPVAGLQAGALGSQPEEKFRSIFIRYAEDQNRYAMRIDHVRAARADAGTNKWKYPDVVVLDWTVGEADDQGYQLDEHMLEVKKSLGDQPFRLTSVELKVDLTLSTFREHFFQCVSNSRWAHQAVLAVAAPLSDATLREELRRLGASYNITIISYSLDPKFIGTLPPADAIKEMPDENFDDIAEQIRLDTIASSRQEANLDWEHIKDMQDRTTDFVLLFEWIAACLRKKKALSLDEYNFHREHLA